MCYLYTFKTEINKNKTQLHITRSSPCSNFPLNNQIAPLWGVGPSLGNTVLTDMYEDRVCTLYDLLKMAHYVKLIVTNRRGRGFKNS